MRVLIVVLSLALLSGGCEKRVDLAVLMEQPQESGFLLIDCDMIEKEDKLFYFDDNVAIGLENCSIVKEGDDGQPIEAQVQLGCFIFRNLEPGRYCIKSISGKLNRPDDKDDKPDEGSPFVSTREYRYWYEFPLWGVRDVVFEVAVGAPTYLGKIIITEPYRRHSSWDDNTSWNTVKRVGESEKVEIHRTAKNERNAWKFFLHHYPESPWSEMVKQRLEGLSGE